MSFADAFAKTIGHEGDFSDDPNDTGGKTRFGITEAVARANGYQGDMRQLPFAKAQEIAKTQYWDVLRLDDVARLSQPIADELFDTSYNMGVGIAARFLQRALNALNRGAKDFPDTVVDGAVGPLTIAALAEYLKRRGQDGQIVMLRALNAQQGERYISISENRVENESFTYGWFLRRVT